MSFYVFQYVISVMQPDYSSSFEASYFFVSFPVKIQVDFLNFPPAVRLLKMHIHALFVSPSKKHIYIAHANVPDTKSLSLPEVFDIFGPFSLSFVIRNSEERREKKQWDKKVKRMERKGRRALRVIEIF